MLLPSMGYSQSQTQLSDGVFSASQVERGAESFAQECMDCHDVAEFTGAAAFFDDQVGESLWDIFEFIWAEMPEDRPAWLEPTEYADILSYLLSVYGFPAGSEDMPIDKPSLNAISMAIPERRGS